MLCGAFCRILCVQIWLFAGTFVRILTGNSTRVVICVATTQPANSPLVFCVSVVLSVLFLDECAVCYNVYTLVGIELLLLE